MHEQHGLQMGLIEWLKHAWQQHKQAQSSKVSTPPKPPSTPRSHTSHAIDAASPASLPRPPSSTRKKRSRGHVDSSDSSSGDGLVLLHHVDEDGADVDVDGDEDWSVDTTIFRENDSMTVEEDDMNDPTPSSGFSTPRFGFHSTKSSSTRRNNVLTPSASGLLPPPVFSSQHHHARPSSHKRGRTEAQRAVFSVGRGGTSRHHYHTLPSPYSYTPSPQNSRLLQPPSSLMGSAGRMMDASHSRSRSDDGWIRSSWTIPLNHIVGIDFSISLDTPAMVTLALKPHCVYTTQPRKADMGGQVFHQAAAAVANLPPYSPARLLLASYRSVAARDPVRVRKWTRVIQAAFPPLLFHIWLHSTYTACACLITGFVCMHWRFWLSAFTLFLLYFIQLIQAFFRSQQEFRDRLLQHRQPSDEAMYVHIHFAAESYTSFLSFRRLFLAAAPVFTAPSASSTAPSTLISSTLPSSLQWSAPSPPVPAGRFQLSRLQEILPSSPLYFENVYADFVFYLLLAPRIFASARARSVTHFLLPVLYLGQAFVSAVRALSPVAVQGFVYLSPYLLVELHWFLTVLNTIPNPLSFIFRSFLPLIWLREVVGVWVMDVAAVAFNAWSQILGAIYTFSAPIRWLNAFLSPLLEFIRQEARALWGLSVLFQPIVVVLLRVQQELMRVWSAFSSIISLLGTVIRALIPTRLFGLIGFMRSSATATAAVGSGLARTGGVSRWRSMWQSLQDFAGLIGKWKVVIDRIRLWLQVWIWELVHRRDAQNIHEMVANPNLNVPLVRPLQRTQSEMADVVEPDDERRQATESKSSSGNEGPMPSRNPVLLTPRQSIGGDPSAVSDLSGQLSSGPLSSASSSSSSPNVLPSPPAFVLSPLHPEPDSFSLPPPSPHFSGFDPTPVPRFHPVVPIPLPSMPPLSLSITAPNSRGIGVQLNWANRGGLGGLGGGETEQKEQEAVIDELEADEQKDDGRSITAPLIYTQEDELAPTANSDVNQDSGSFIRKRHTGYNSPNEHEETKSGNHSPSWRMQ